MTNRCDGNLEDAIQHLTEARLATYQLRSILHRANWVEDGSSALAEDICRQVLKSIEKALSFLVTGRNRRQDQISHSIVTTTPHGDREEWRVFGNKQVLDSDYIRYYYRCQYCEECPATKRVQQIDSCNPPKFLVTYITEHTCSNNNMLPVPTSSIDSSLTDEESAM